MEGNSACDLRFPAWRDDYDFIIIDCPPNLGLLTFNALLAASEVAIPIDISYFSLHGLSKLLETINLAEQQMRPLAHNERPGHQLRSETEAFRRNSE